MNKKLYKLTLDTQKSIGALSELAYETGVQDGLIKANALNALKPLDNAKERWIPCSERLPEEGERVLCTHLGGLNPNRQVIEHIYQNGEFVSGWDMDMNPSSSTFGQRYMGKVIAWMPLPEPYKENNDQ